VVVSPEMWKIAEAESFPSNEGSMCAVAMRDGDAPPGSWTASCLEGHRRNRRGPTGSAGLVSGGGGWRGTAAAAFRAEVGSRTGS
jgi:hypothetical protein